MRYSGVLLYIIAEQIQGQVHKSWAHWLTISIGFNVNCILIYPNLTMLNQHGITYILSQTREFLKRKRDSYSCNVKHATWYIQKEIILLKVEKIVINGKSTQCIVTQKKHVYTLSTDNISCIKILQITFKYKCIQLWSEKRIKVRNRAD